MKVSNPFENKDEAVRYHKFRPSYHALPFGLIRDWTQKDFDYSLDVACGTGQSTAALSRISKKVVGGDQSEAMLAVARANSKIDFIRADAENLPFANQTFDFLNISMGFHWVDQEKFLLEARRVLKSHGLIAIDSYGFTGKISGDSEKQKLHNDFFMQYLPPASRRDAYPTAELASRTRLEPAKEIEYEHLVPLDADQFTNLIKTWSNFQIQSEEKKAITSQKMTEIYGQIFAGGTLHLPFRGKSMIYKLL